MEKHTITISVGGRQYQYFVSPDDEARYRDAVSKIEERVKFYCRKFPDKEMQDIMSIVLLEITLKYQSLENRDTVDTNDLRRQLEVLDNKLESYVNSR